MIGIGILMGLWVIGIIAAYVFDYKRDPKYFKEGIKGMLKKILSVFIINKIDD